LFPQPPGLSIAYRAALQKAALGYTLAEGARSVFVDGIAKRSVSSAIPKAVRPWGCHPRCLQGWTARRL